MHDDHKHSDELHSREKFFYSVAHQLPFYLTANRILKATGYRKFCSKISPLSSPNSLLSIQFDAPTMEHRFWISLFSNYRHLETVFLMKRDMPA
jgi:hypothetical protein